MSAESSSTVGTTVENKTHTAIFAVIGACGAYFCMYMYRKPFTAGKFADQALWGLSYKSILVISQVLGYATSKFVGIKYVAEMDRSRRLVTLLALISIAELALVGFGLTPIPYNFFWLILNGLPLGLVFGLVLGFLEGRSQTEMLTAGLCTTFVSADGFAKSIGTSVIARGVSETWMPAVVGLLFAGPMVLFCWLLSKVPAPSAIDVSLRSERIPMTLSDRKHLFKRYFGGLSLVLLVYGAVGIIRGVRSDFAPEIWAGLRTKINPSVYGTSEMLAGLGVLLVFAYTSRIKDNRRALFTGIGAAIAGCVVLAASQLAQSLGWISPYIFMVSSAFGLYLPYFAVHISIFERLIAFTRERGNIGYLMYLADAGSYGAYVFVLLARNLMKPGPEAFLPFFIGLNWTIAALGILALIPAFVYFQQVKSPV